jgi:hypothetical protein
MTKPTEQEIADEKDDIIARVHESKLAGSDVPQEATIEFYEAIIGDLEFEVSVIRSEMDDPDD